VAGHILADGAVTRALIVDPAFLGDVVFDGPLVAALKRRGAQIGLVVRPPAEQLAARIRGVDRVHVFDKRGRDAGLSGLSRVAAELRRERYDVALIPHGSVRSAALARWAGIPRRIGCSSWPGSWLLTDRVESDPAASFVKLRLDLIGEAESTLAGTLVAEGAAREKARVGFVIGAQWETKIWPLERAVEWVRALDRERVELVLLGAEWERARADALLDAIGGEARRSVVDAVGESVSQLIDRLAGCDVVVGGDTGPLHIARALGVPVIALFGPTPETRHRFAERDALLVVDLACRPCDAHGPRRCPEGHHRCMRELGGDRVLGAVQRALEARERP
jgi:heptosyltransferase-2